MKKVLLSALALCCSLAALAQAPTTPDARRADKAAKERKQEAKTKQRGDDDRDGDKASKPANHGQTVSTFAKTTPLTGADKGAAVSAVARGGRSTARGERSARGGERGHGSRPAGSGHQGSSRAAAADAAAAANCRTCPLGRRVSRLSRNAAGFAGCRPPICRLRPLGLVLIRCLLL
ncbi:hypothetical protein BEN47_18645 [Hymenobacter lapidarius]|uniref:Uncharacterized protein n=1 Tax=Hymenobacter lapidarius TaxID=1908237 RepID=A0A1G1SUF6_9BACT|nr:hypothetical protein [Hymenobacter lapidarius]OGX82248.1 hypothetical protein BEN47_18645 [Hymenobacter lapidarius]